MSISIVSCSYIYRNNNYRLKIKRARRCRISLYGMTRSIVVRRVDENRSGHRPIFVPIIQTLFIEARLFDLYISDCHCHRTFNGQFQGRIIKNWDRPITRYGVVPKIFWADNFSGGEAVKSSGSRTDFDHSCLCPYL